MPSMQLIQSDDFRILSMNDGGLFNHDSLAEFNAALNAVEADESVQGLILTGEGHVFSQGLDLDKLLAMEQAQFKQFVEQCIKLLGRLLCFPLPVIGAINGHAFGLAAMIVLSCDYKVMRTDRGFFCLPEVDIEMPFQPGMNALVTHKLSANVLRDAILTGKRFTGEDAFANGIVDRCCEPDQLIDIAKEIAAPMLGKNREVLAAIKQGMHLPVTAVIKSIV